MLEQHRRRPAPRRPPNAAHGCGRAARASCARAAARSAGLEKRVAPSARVWSAPSTSRPGMRCRDNGRLFARQQSAAIGGRRLQTRSACFQAALVDDRPDGARPERRLPQAASRRTALRDASTSGSRAQAIAPLVMTPGAGGARRAAPAPRPRFPRSSAASRRSAANCAWRTAGAKRQPPPPPIVWSIYLSSSRCALRPSSRFCRICTMRSGRGKQADHQRLLQRSRLPGGSGTPGTSGTLAVFTPRLAR